MVLVTLGGCHLLDGLVVVSVEARKEDCAVLQRSDCEGDCAHPVGATKSNPRACGSVGSSARACGKHSTWESVTFGSPLARGPTTNLELVSTGT